MEVHNPVNYYSKIYLNKLTADLNKNYDCQDIVIDTSLKFEFVRGNSKYSVSIIDIYPSDGFNVFWDMYCFNLKSKSLIITGRIRESAIHNSGNDCYFIIPIQNFANSLKDKIVNTEYCSKRVLILPTE